LDQREKDEGRRVVRICESPMISTPDELRKKGTR
jgi:hypothetical protein